MAQIGTNIARDGWIPVDRIRGMGAKVVRIVANHEAHVGDYLDQITRDGKIRVWMAFDSESFSGFSDWASAFDEYRSRYERFVSVWQIGNEPDLVSPSSWTLAQGTLSNMLFTARDRFGSDAKLCVGGLASGHPGWLGGDDPSWMQNGTPAPAGYEFAEHGKPVDLRWVNAVAIHPYGQGPDARFELDPSWYFGRVDRKLIEYRDWLAPNWSDKTLHITEWGAPIWDFTPTRGARPTDVTAYLQATRRRTRRSPATRASGAPRQRQGAYIKNMARTLMDTNLAGDAIHFCFSDGMVAGFGMTDESLSHWPAADGLLALTAPVGGPV